MKSRNEAVFDRVVSDCCLELFASAGVSLRPSVLPATPPAPSVSSASSAAKTGAAELVAGRIAFSGPNVNGSLALLTTPSVLERGIPSKSGRPVTAAVRTLLLRDWACELTNQLMGRVRNRILNVGLEVTTSTPSPMSGAPVQALLTSRDKRTAFRFQAGTDEVTVFFEVHMDPSFDMDAFEPKSGKEPAQEGAVIIF